MHSSSASSSNASTASTASASASGSATPADASAPVAWPAITVKGATRPVPHLPGGRPLLGYLTEFRNDRIGVLMRLSRTYPEMVEMPMGLFIRRVNVTSSPVIANEVLTTKQASFEKTPGLTLFLRPVLGDGLLTSEKAVHEKQRRLLAPAFAHKRIAGYAATMAERTEKLAMRLRQEPPAKPLDLSEEMMRLTFEIVGKTLFDAEVVGDATAVGDALTTAMEVAMGQLGSVVPIPPQVPTPQNLKYRRAVHALDELVYRVIRDRRGQGGDRGDVLSMLLSARDEDGSSMTDKQVRDEAMTLFLAGHETTANALTWTFYLLARHPDKRAKMEAELDALGRTPSYDDLKLLPYTLAVFKEAMRLYPPAYIIGRRAIADVTVGEHRIKKGGIVMINVIGIHHREDLWPNAEAFEPERFLADNAKDIARCAYMPFGAGPRICIGNHFAMMEGHTLLATIARHVRFELTSDAKVDLEPLVTLRPRGGLPVTAHARS